MKATTEDVDALLSGLSCYFAAVAVITVFSVATMDVDVATTAVSGLSYYSSAVAETTTADVDAATASANSYLQEKPGKPGFFLF